MPGWRSRPEPRSKPGVTPMADADAPGSLSTRIVGRRSASTDRQLCVRLFVMRSPPTLPIDRHQQTSDGADSVVTEPRLSRKGGHTEASRDGYRTIVVGIGNAAHAIE